ncbi:MAG: glycosyltransferase [Pseudomonadota bacterium]|nr:glycosyltransferase [Pseudomonadota bacterium]
MTRLALIMIVRNEARCIARCLRSASPLVEQMIVVDTGSTDETVRIAEQLGAQVHHVAWTDDFSAARNAALDYSSAQWNLVLDADEWVDAAAGKAVLDTALAGTEPFLGLLPITSEFDLHGSVEMTTTWIPRLLPRGVRYRGRIHEQPVCELAARRIALTVFHDGYRSTSLEQKKGRNESLLLRALEEAPNDPYLLYKLGGTYEVDQDYNSAVEYFEQALRLTPAAQPFRHDLVVRSIFSLKKAGRHAAAIALAETEMKNWQHSPDFFFVLGDLLLDWASLNPATAFQELLPIVESSWLKCLELGDQPMLAGSVKGRGTHLAAHNLAVLYAGLGDTRSAAHFEKLAAVRSVS